MKASRGSSLWGYAPIVSPSASSAGRSFALCTAKSIELNDWYKEQLEANGMTVQKAEGQLRDDMVAIGETMTAEWLEATGEAGQAIVDAFKAQ